MRIIDVASDVYETINVYTDDMNSASLTDKLVNEFGEYSFECDMDVEYDYIRPEPGVGLSYDFEVTSVDVDVKKVYDSEGEEVFVNKKNLFQIGKLLERNLTFEIYKK